MGSHLGRALTPGQSREASITIFCPLQMRTPRLRGQSNLSKASQLVSSRAWVPNLLHLTAAPPLHPLHHWLSAGG